MAPLELTVGSRVLLQSQRTREWSYPGKIVAVRPGGRSAFVEVNGGSTILRNRRFLKMDPAYILSEADISAALSLLSAVVQPASILKKAGPRRALSGPGRAVTFRLPCAHSDVAGGKEELCQGFTAAGDSPHCCWAAPDSSHSFCLQ